MCGIFGVINPTGKFVQGVFSLLPDLIQVGDIRGTDGTGLVKVYRDGTATWIKAAVPGHSFLNVEGVKDFTFGVGDLPFIIGHHRSATRGTIDNDNTHPFKRDSIYMVHNGTVTRTDELGLGERLPNDSEMICNHIAKKGIQSAVNEIWGAYSLVWYDEDKQTLNFTRNAERPMNFIHTKEGIIIYCSEVMMGEWLAARRGFTVTKTESTVIHTLYEFKKGDAKPKVSELKPTRPVVVSSKKSKGSSRISSTFFAPSSPKALVDKGTLRAAFDRFVIGGLVHFSLADFDEPKKKGKFVRIQGEHPTLPEVICSGNYSGDVEILWSTKHLLSGVVATKGMDMKKGKVNLQLRDIKLTNLPDPFFVEAQKELAAAQQEPAKVIPINHKKKNSLRTDACMDCGHIFTRSNSDVPYITVRSGEAKCLCTICFLDNKDVTQAIKH